MNKLFFWILALAITFYIAYVKTYKKNPLFDIFRTKVELEEVDYGAPMDFSSDDTKEMWLGLNNESKKKALRNIVNMTGTKYSDFPEWIKSDPITISIEDELK